MGMGAARVIWSFNDLSLYVKQLMAGYVFALIQAERGPLWTPVPVTSVDEYERWFGRTFTGSVDPLVIKIGLMQGAKFIIMRVVHCTDASDPSTMTAVASSVTLEDQGAAQLPASIATDPDPFTITAPAAGTVTGTEVGPFTFGVGASDAFKVKVGTHDAQTVTLVGAGITAETVAGQINAGTDYLTATVANGRIKVTANVVTDDLEIQAVTNDAYTHLGLTVAVYDATAGTDSLVLAIHGQSDQTFTLTAGIRSAAQIQADLADVLGASLSVSGGVLTIRTTETGASATLQVKNTSTCTTALGVDNDVHSGSVGTVQDTLTFAAKNPGVWGDGLKVYPMENRLDTNGSFDVKVTYSEQGGLNEYWKQVNMDPESDRYVVNYINARSKLITVTDLASVSAAPNNRPAYSTTGVALTGGNDGLADFADNDWIGDELAHTGIYAADIISDRTDMALHYIIPGTTSYAVAQALTAYCEDRGLMAHIMVPSGGDPEDALEYRNGESPWTFEKWNNAHLALQFGRPTLYDAKYDAHREACSNLGLWAVCLAKIQDTSRAPAGPEFGTVQMVEGIDFNLASYPGYQDEFADNQINFLELTRTEGAVFWQQNTTLIANSSMQSIGIMNFLLAMKKMFMPVLRQFINKPNHPDTWGEVHRILEPQLRIWKARGDIYSFELETDRHAVFDDTGALRGAVLNTEEEIQQRIYHARVLVQPTQDIEYFEFEVGVLATGELYSNFSSMHTLPGWIRR